MEQRGGSSVCCRDDGWRDRDLKVHVEYNDNLYILDLSNSNLTFFMYC